jgi:hypothetical protein
MMIFLSVVFILALLIQRAKLHIYFKKMKNKKENDELLHKIPTFARQIPKQTHGKVIQGTTESIV